MPVVRPNDHLVTPRCLNEDYLVNALFVLCPLQQVADVSFEHLVYLRMCVAELQVHAPVAVAVHLDKLKPNVERWDDRDVIAEVMEPDGLRVGGAERQVTVHVVRVAVGGRLEPRRIERDLTKVLEPPYVGVRSAVLQT